MLKKYKKILLTFLGALSALSIVFLPAYINKSYSETKDVWLNYTVPSSYSDFDNYEFWYGYSKTYANIEHSLTDIGIANINNIIAQVDAGLGTSDPIIINSAEELAGLSLLSNCVDTYLYYCDLSYALSSDINLGGRRWIPIGTEYDFTGDFNGNNHIISGLTINNATATYQGLFGHLSGFSSDYSEIDNVIIENAYINSGGFTGAIVGDCTYTILTDCHSIGSGAIVGTNVVIGGLVGEAKENTRLDSCSNAIDVKGLSSFVGGLVGNWKGRSISSTAFDIDNCYNVGSVTSGADGAGGLIGSFNVLANGTISKISNSYNSGTIKAGTSGEYNNVAGIVYYNNFNGGTNLIIENCHNVGSIYGKMYTAGLISIRSGLSIPLTVIKSYNTGDIISPTASSSTGFNAGLVACSSGTNTISITESFNAGNVTNLATEAGAGHGIAGILSNAVSGTTITNCYNTGIITGDINVAGILGYSTYSANISYCYNAGTINAINHYAGGIVGRAYSEIVNNVYNTATINLGLNAGKGTYSGGLIGTSSNSISLTYAYNSGNIVIDPTATVHAHIGGLIGVVENNSLTVQYSYNSGTVTNGTTNLGSLFGYMDYGPYPNVNNNVGTSAITKLANIDGGYSLSATNIKVSPTLMKNKATYVDDGWSSFDTYFTINETVDTPRLIPNPAAEMPVLYASPEAPSTSGNWSTHTSAATIVDTYYQIDTPQKLAWMSAQINAGNNKSANYILTADIDLSDYLWTPISSTDDENTFTGLFDGNGYTINGLTINDNAATYAGLFGYVAGTIQNVILENAYIKADSFSGTIAGSLDSNALVKNCYASGDIILTNSSSYSGGLIGWATNCQMLLVYNNVNVYGGSYLGGIAGFASATTFTAAYNEGRIYSTGLEVGGLVGEFNASNIDQSFNNGLVIGTCDVGGLAGYIQFNSSGNYIQRSYNRGKVVATTITLGDGNKSGAGGIAGYVLGSGGSIKATYNSSEVVSPDRSAGLVSYMSDASVLSYSAYNTDFVLGASKTITDTTTGLLDTNFTHIRSGSTVFMKLNETYANSSTGVWFSASCILGNPFAITTSGATGGFNNVDSNTMPRVYAPVLSASAYISNNGMVYKAGTDNTKVVFVANLSSRANPFQKLDFYIESYDTKSNQYAYKYVFNAESEAIAVNTYNLYPSNLGVIEYTSTELRVLSGSVENIALDGDPIMYLGNTHTFDTSFVNGTGGPLIVYLDILGSDYSVVATMSQKIDEFTTEVSFDIQPHNVYDETSETYILLTANSTYLIRIRIYSTFIDYTFEIDQNDRLNIPVAYQPINSMLLELLPNQEPKVNGDAVNYNITLATLVTDNLQYIDPSATIQLMLKTNSSRAVGTAMRVSDDENNIIETLLLSYAVTSDDLVDAYNSGTSSNPILTFFAKITNKGSPLSNNLAVEFTVITITDLTLDSTNFEPLDTVKVYEIINFVADLTIPDINELNPTDLEFYKITGAGDVLFETLEVNQTSVTLVSDDIYRITLDYEVLPEDLNTTLQVYAVCSDWTSDTLQYIITYAGVSSLEIIYTTDVSLQKLGQAQNFKINAYNVKGTQVALDFVSLTRSKVNVVISKGGIPYTDETFNDLPVESDGLVPPDFTPTNSTGGVGQYLITTTLVSDALITDSLNFDIGYATPDDYTFTLTPISLTVRPSDISSTDYQEYTLSIATTDWQNLDPITVVNFELVNSSSTVLENYSTTIADFETDGINKSYIATFAIPTNIGNYTINAYIGTGAGSSIITASLIVNYAITLGFTPTYDMAIGTVAKFIITLTQEGVTYDELDENTKFDIVATSMGNKVIATILLKDAEVDADFKELYIYYTYANTDLIPDGSSTFYITVKVVVDDYVESSPPITISGIKSPSVDIVMSLPDGFTEGTAGEIYTLKITFTGSISLLNPDENVYIFKAPVSTAIVMSVNEILVDTITVADGEKIGETWVIYYDYLVQPEDVANTSSYIEFITQTYGGLADVSPDLRMATDYCKSYVIEVTPEISTITRSEQLTLFVKVFNAKNIKKSSTKIVISITDSGYTPMFDGLFDDVFLTTAPTSTSGTNNEDYIYEYTINQVGQFGYPWASDSYYFNADIVYNSAVQNTDTATIEVTYVSPNVDINLSPNTATVGVEQTFIVNIPDYALLNPDLLVYFTIKDSLNDTLSSNDTKIIAQNVAYSYTFDTAGTYTISANIEGRTLDAQILSVTTSWATINTMSLVYTDETYTDVITGYGVNVNTILYFYVTVNNGMPIKYLDPSLNIVLSNDTRTVTIDTKAISAVLAVDPNATKITFSSYTTLPDDADIGSIRILAEFSTSEFADLNFAVSYKDITDIVLTYSGDVPARAGHTVTIDYTILGIEDVIETHYDYIQLINFGTGSALTANVPISNGLTGTFSYTITMTDALTGEIALEAIVVSSSPQISSADNLLLDTDYETLDNVTIDITSDALNTNRLGSEQNFIVTVSGITYVNPLENILFSVTDPLSESVTVPVSTLSLSNGTTIGDVCTLNFAFTPEIIRSGHTTDDYSVYIRIENTKTNLDVISSELIYTVNYAVVNDDCIDITISTNNEYAEIGIEKEFTVTVTGWQYLDPTQNIVLNVLDTTILISQAVLAENNFAVTFTATEVGNKTVQANITDVSGSKLDEVTIAVSYAQVLGIMFSATGNLGTVYAGSSLTVEVGETVTFNAVLTISNDNSVNNLNPSVILEMIRSIEPQLTGYSFTDISIASENSFDLVYTLVATDKAGFTIYAKSGTISTSTIILVVEYAYISNIALETENDSIVSASTLLEFSASFSEDYNTLEPDFSIQFYYTYNSIITVLNTTEITADAVGTYEFSYQTVASDIGKTYLFSTRIIKSDESIDTRTTSDDIAIDITYAVASYANITVAPVNASMTQSESKDYTVTISNIEYFVGSDYILHIVGYFLDDATPDDDTDSSFVVGNVNINGGAFSGTTYLLDDFTPVSFGYNNTGEYKIDFYLETATLNGKTAHLRVNVGDFDIAITPLNSTIILGFSETYSVVVTPVIQLQSGSKIRMVITDEDATLMYEETVSINLTDGSASFTAYTPLSVGTYAITMELTDDLNNIPFETEITELIVVYDTVSSLVLSAKEFPAGTNYDEGDVVFIGTEIEYSITVTATNNLSNINPNTTIRIFNNTRDIYLSDYLNILNLIDVNKITFTYIVQQEDYDVITVYAVIMDGTSQSTPVSNSFMLSVGYVPITVIALVCNDDEPVQVGSEISFTSSVDETIDITAINPNSYLRLYKITKPDEFDAYTTITRVSQDKITAITVPFASKYTVTSTDRTNGIIYFIAILTINNLEQTTTSVVIELDVTSAEITNDKIQISPADSSVKIGFSIDFTVTILDYEMFDQSLEVQFDVSKKYNVSDGTTLPIAITYTETVALSTGTVVGTNAVFTFTYTPDYENGFVVLRPEVTVGSAMNFATLTVIYANPADLGISLVSQDDTYTGIINTEKIFIATVPNFEYLDPNTIIKFEVFNSANSLVGYETKLVSDLLPEIDLETSGYTTFGFTPLAIGTFTVKVTAVKLNELGQFSEILSSTAQVSLSVAFASVTDVSIVSAVIAGSVISSGSTAYIADIVQFNLFITADGSINSINPLTKVQLYKYVDSVIVKLGEPIQVITSGDTIIGELSISYKLLQNDYGALEVFASVLLGDNSVDETVTCTSTFTLNVEYVKISQLQVTYTGSSTVRAGSDITFNIAIIYPDGKDYTTINPTTIITLYKIMDTDISLEFQAVTGSALTFSYRVLPQDATLGTLSVYAISSEIDGVTSNTYVLTADYIDPDNDNGLLNITITPLETSVHLGGEVEFTVEIMNGDYLDPQTKIYLKTYTPSPNSTLLIQQTMLIENFTFTNVGGIYYASNIFILNPTERIVGQYTINSIIGNLYDLDGLSNKIATAVLNVDYADASDDYILIGIDPLTDEAYPSNSPRSFIVTITGAEFMSDNYEVRFNIDGPVISNTTTTISEFLKNIDAYTLLVTSNIVGEYTISASIGEQMLNEETGLLEGVIKTTNPPAILNVIYATVDTAELVYNGGATAVVAGTDIEFILEITSLSVIDIDPTTLFKLTITRASGIAPIIQTLTLTYADMVVIDTTNASIVFTYKALGFDVPSITIQGYVYKTELDFIETDSIIVYVEYSEITSLNIYMPDSSPARAGMDIYIRIDISVDYTYIAQNTQLNVRLYSLAGEIDLTRITINSTTVPDAINSNEIGFWYKVKPSDAWCSTVMFYVEVVDHTEVNDSENMSFAYADPDDAIIGIKLQAYNEETTIYEDIDTDACTLGQEQVYRAVIVNANYLAPGTVFTISVTNPLGVVTFTEIYIDLFEGLSDPEIINLIDIDTDFNYDEFSLTPTIDTGGIGNYLIEDIIGTAQTKRDAISLAVTYATPDDERVYISVNPSDSIEAIINENITFSVTVYGYEWIDPDAVENSVFMVLYRKTVEFPEGNLGGTPDYSMSFLVRANNNGIITFTFKRAEIANYVAHFYIGAKSQDVDLSVRYARITDMVLETIGQYAILGKPLSFKVTLTFESALANLDPSTIITISRYSYEWSIINALAFKDSVTSLTESFIVLTYNNVSIEDFSNGELVVYASAGVSNGTDGYDIYLIEDPINVTVKYSDVESLFLEYNGSNPVLVNTEINLTVNISVQNINYINPATIIELLRFNGTDWVIVMLSDAICSEAIYNEELGVYIVEFAYLTTLADATMGTAHLKVRAMPSTADVPIESNELLINVEYLSLVSSNLTLEARYNGILITDQDTIKVGETVEYIMLISAEDIEFVNPNTVIELRQSGTNFGDEYLFVTPVLSEIIGGTVTFEHILLTGNVPQVNITAYVKGNDAVYSNNVAFKVGYKAIEGLNLEYMGSGTLVKSGETIVFSAVIFTTDINSIDPKTKIALRNSVTGLNLVIQAIAITVDLQGIATLNYKVTVADAEIASLSIYAVVLGNETVESNLITLNVDYGAMEINSGNTILSVEASSLTPIVNYEVLLTFKATIAESYKENIDYSTRVTLFVPGVTWISPATAYSPTLNELCSETGYRISVKFVNEGTYEIYSKVETVESPRLSITSRLATNNITLTVSGSKSQFIGLETEVIFTAEIDSGDIDLIGWSVNSVDQFVTGATFAFTPLDGAKDYVVKAYIITDPDIYAEETITVNPEKAVKTFWQSILSINTLIIFGVIFLAFAIVMSIVSKKTGSN